MADEAAMVKKLTEQYLSDLNTAMGSRTRYKRLSTAIIQGLGAAYAGMDLSALFASDDLPSGPHIWKASPYRDNYELWERDFAKKAPHFDPEHYYQAAKRYGEQHGRKRYTDWLEAALTWAKRDHINRRAVMRKGTKIVTKDDLSAKFGI